MHEYHMKCVWQQHTTDIQYMQLFIKSLLMLKGDPMHVTLLHTLWYKLTEG